LIKDRPLTRLYNSIPDDEGRKTLCNYCNRTVVILGRSNSRMMVTVDLIPDKDGEYHTHQCDEFINATPEVHARVKLERKIRLLAHGQKIFCKPLIKRYGDIINIFMDGVYDRDSVKNDEITPSTEAGKVSTL
jgi:hypothetical protein